jgi:hypothetical protein
MKQSDIFSIIIIATVGTLLSYFFVNSLLGNPDLEIVNIKTIQEISPNISSPDPELFNPEAINPTVEVFVGECEDLDQNGILSRDELIACGKISEGQQETEYVFCADGAAVTDISLCPENQQQETEEQEEESGIVEYHSPDGETITIEE